jgi:hypothetical protein
MRTYYFKEYVRTKSGGTCGEPIRRVAIEAEGLGYAQQIAERDFLPNIDLTRHFAILEGNDPEDFVKCWFAECDYA